MNHSLILTADGSPTLKHAVHGETYHSTTGALQESQHVFINAGLMPLLEHKSMIRILEVGLGTGLNVWLTFLTVAKTAKEIYYTAFEPEPVAMEVVAQIPPPLAPPLIRGAGGIFHKIHSCTWNQLHTLSKNFFFTKYIEKFEDATLTEKFDLVYFDAFSPQVQPELWTEKVFLKIFTAMTKDAVLVTYCAKGEVKRILKKVGFTVKSLAGAPGKREMIRAEKP